MSIYEALEKSDIEGRAKGGRPATNKGKRQKGQGQYDLYNYYGDDDFGYGGGNRRGG